MDILEGTAVTSIPDVGRPFPKWNEWKQYQWMVNTLNTRLEFAGVASSTRNQYFSFPPPSYNDSR
jgi:hypothetical protein